ncbi:MerR family transcriptional regulator [Desulfobotulus pelophilus]|nr:MerR family DNA-binding transcriptional regulator [Desulfobotulus pelophilus]
MNSIKMYAISELAAELEISPSTIRFYEDKGLISPERSAGNQRLYSRKHKARLKLILRGKRFGFSLAEIAEMIGYADVPLHEADQIRKSLAFGREKLEEIRRKKEDLALLEADILSMQEFLEKRLQSIK